jgi:hypothetical protein
MRRAGKMQLEAYAASGFGKSTSRPALLAKDRRIVARVDKILAERQRVEAKVTERAIKRSAITKERIIEMLLADRDLARQKGQAAAAIRAAELLGKELGMFIDRKETRVVDEFADWTADELMAYIKGEIRADDLGNKFAC